MESMAVSKHMRKKHTIYRNLQIIEKDPWKQKKKSMASVEIFENQKSYMKVYENPVEIYDHHWEYIEIL